MASPACKSNARANEGRSAALAGKELLLKRLQSSSAVVGTAAALGDIWRKNRIGQQSPADRQRIADVHEGAHRRISRLAAALWTTHWKGGPAFGGVPREHRKLSRACGSATGQRSPGLWCQRLSMTCLNLQPSRRRHPACTCRREVRRWIHGIR